jgi:hypothetical protein
VSGCVRLCPAVSGCVRLRPAASGWIRLVAPHTIPGCWPSGLMSSMNAMINGCGATSEQFGGSLFERALSYSSTQPFLPSEHAIRPYTSPCSSGTPTPIATPCAARPPTNGSTPRQLRTRWAEDKPPPIGLGHQHAALALCRADHSRPNIAAALRPGPRRSLTLRGLMVSRAAER